MNMLFCKHLTMFVLEYVYCFFFYKRPVNANDV